MDTFLRSAGLSLHVGNPLLNYEGLSDTIKLSDFAEFGEMLNHIAKMQVTSTI